MARFSALLGLLIVLLGAIHWWKPFLTQDRFVVTATPSPGPTGQIVDIPLTAGSRVCVAPAPIDRATAQVQVILAPTTRPLRLDVEAAGGGYRFSRPVQVPASPVLQRVNAPIASPSRDVVGSICVRNSGDTAAALAGTNNGLWIGTATTSLDGRQLTGQAIALNLLEARRQSILDRLGTILDRVAGFTGELMPSWLAWMIVVALVVGTPLAVFGGLWLTLRDA
jgi:hypothetical protein